MAFTASTPILSKAIALRATSFTSSIDTTASPATARNDRTPRMALRAGITRSAGTAASKFGGVDKLLSKADEYMAKSVAMQYYAMSQPSGVYTSQCTEGSVKGAAEAARVRALNTEFREKQKSPAQVYGNMYEYRLAATYADHICSVEAKQFSQFSKLSKTYCLARAEAMGTCDRYATPESVEEAAMLRFMDIQQKASVSGSGVYNSQCNEGSCKGAAEDLRVAALAQAYRQAQKSTGKLLQEKYNQRQWGYLFANGCSYEEDLISKFPAIGANFRLKAYGY